MKTVTKIIGVLATIVATLLTFALAFAALWSWAQRPPAPLPSPGRNLTLGRVTLVEPGGRDRRRAELRIEEGRIVGVAPPRSGGHLPFADAYVLPGLTDMHAHLPMSNLPGDAEYTLLLLLAHGVTTVRLPGGTDAETVDRLRGRSARGELPGPRIFSCGAFVDGPNPVLPGSRIVTSPKEARAVVADLASEGADCIKAYDTLDLASTTALREAAEAHGLPLIGHTPHDVALEEAQLADVQHLRGVQPPFEGERRDYPHVLRPWLRMDGARLAHVIEVSRRYGMAYTPTLVAVEGMLRARDWASWRASPTMQLSLPHLRDALWSAEVGLNPARHMSADDFAVVKNASDWLKRSAAALHEAGIPLHTGTDCNAPNVIPGASLLRELVLLVEVGLTAEEAIEASTRTSPTFLGVAGAGTLRVGAPADLLLLREDPTRDIAALDTLLAVVHDGRLYTRDDLDERLARYRAHYEGFGYRSIVMPTLRSMARIGTVLLRN